MLAVTKTTDTPHITDKFIISPDLLFLVYLLAQ